MPSNQPDPRQESKTTPGVAERDIALVERLAGDLAKLARAMRKGDKEAAKAVYPNLLKIVREAERVRVIARRAFSRTE